MVYYSINLWNNNLPQKSFLHNVRNDRLFSRNLIVLKLMVTHKGKIVEINLRILVNVSPFAPIGRSAASFKPMRRKKTKVFETVIDYLNGVYAVKILAAGK